MLFRNNGIKGFKKGETKSFTSSVESWNTGGSTTKDNAHPRGKRDKSASGI